MNIEDAKPINVLADRVWSGTHWHYPNIEKMVAELTTLRAQVAGLEERAVRAEKVVAAVEHSMGCAGAWHIGCSCQHIWHTKMADAISEYRAALTPPAPQQEKHRG